MSEYIGNRIVPRHDGVWQADKAYESLTIVLENGTGDSYISRKPVPAGTALSQKDYWAVCSRFSEQMKLFRDGVNEDVVQMHKHLDQTVDAVNKTASDTINTVNQKTDDTLAAMTERTEAAEQLTSDNKATLEARMKQIETRQDANVTASTDQSADYAAELVDARVDDTGRTFASAGSNMRALGKVRSLQNVARTWPWSDGRIVNENGVYIMMGSWSCLHMIPVAGDHIVITGSLSLMSGKEEYNNIVCFDCNRNYLGGCFRAESGADHYDYLSVPLLERTAFISVTTGTKSKGDISVYLPTDNRTNVLLDSVVSTWQWLNGTVAISFTDVGVAVDFTGNCYLCRYVNGIEYKQNRATAQDSVTVDFPCKGWWAIYFNVEDVEPPAGENDAVASEGRVHVVSADRWQNLFSSNHFIIAAFYDRSPAWVSPSHGPLTINGVDYGNPAKVAGQAFSYGKYLGQSIFLEYGGIALDMEARTIQITKRCLAVGNTVPYFWLEVDEEPVPLLESEELELERMLILGYDHSTKKINLYNTKDFQALKNYGYYIAAWYQGQLWYPHMNSSVSFTLNGVEYKAGQLFASEQYNTSVEKRYQNKIDSITNRFERLSGSRMYLASGAFTIDQAEGVVQITDKMLGVPENYHYLWLPAQEEAVPMVDNTPLATGGYPMRILAVDGRDYSLNLYNGSTFRALGENGYYVASWYNGRLYNASIAPEVMVTVGEKTCKAAELFDTETSTYVEKRYRDYVSSALTVNEDGDNMGDIVTPSHWDCMEGRQFSMFFDCLSRHEGRENLYRVTNSKSLTRNEYCLNYTPKDTDTSFNVNVIRLDADTMAAQETKPVQMRVHHPLETKVVKNICICGDSLVDCNQVATEVYRLLKEDGDCEVKQVGTRGPENGRHEGRGSWKWKDYLGNTSLAGKTNAFWDTETNRLDFQKYCATNGFDGIDYFLIALGTNDVSQGSTLYRTETDVQKFVDYAKQFVDKLLDPEVGFPNCRIGIGLCGPGADYSYLAGSSMGIFRKSINTLNLALIKNFDEGKYHPNVTCFAHGLRTNRRLAFPYSNKPVTDRVEETSRTLTNSIHPSVRGYQAWADGYYCQIRAWLEEDAAK